MLFREQSSLANGLQMLMIGRRHQHCTSRLLNLELSLFSRHDDPRMEDCLGNAFALAACWVRPLSLSDSTNADISNFKLLLVKSGFHF